MATADSEQEERDAVQPSHASTLLPSGSSAQPSSFALDMKSHLLRTLFTAIDSAQQGYLDRTEMLTFVQHEPYLQSPHLQPTVHAMLEALDHDEDSHCSFHEFEATFAPFRPADVARLIVNLIRQMPLPGSRLRKTLTMLETQTVREGGQQSTADAARVQERHKTVYMLDLLFHAIDNDLDGLIEPDELDQFIAHDPYFTADAPCQRQMEAVRALWAEHKSSGRRQPSSSTPSFDGVSQDEFVGVFMALSLQDVIDVFVHLLTRTTSSSLAASGSAGRHRHKDVRHRQKMLDDVLKQDVPAHSQRPTQLVHGKHARLAAPTAAAAPSSPPSRGVSPLVPSRQPPAAALPAALYPPPHGVRLTLLGQCMIQHDLRLSAYGQSRLLAIAPYLKADVVFTELETSIQPAQGGAAQRSTVFLHTAPPVVIDVLRDLGVNLLALANNHAGDLGLAGVKSTLEEVRKRGIVCAGLGMDEDDAAAPAFLTATPQCWKLQQSTEHGNSTDASSPSSPSSPQSPSSPLHGLSSATLSSCPPSITIGLVGHASKIPPGSAATPSSPGVNSLSMSDLTTYTLEPTDVSRILSSVSAARQHASIVIAYQHNHYWTGNGRVNEEHEMGNWKREWAHALIDSGATIYVSHGDPRLQGIELYNHCPLFFCLGSFIFQTGTAIGFYTGEVWQSVIVTIEYHPESSDSLPQSSDSSISSSSSSGSSSSPTHPDRPLDPERAPAARTAPRPSPTFSIKLTPLTLNDVGVPPTPFEEHLATRGLPSVARGEEGRRILLHVRELSAPYGTEVEIEEGDDGAVIGWVTAAADKPKPNVGVAAPAQRTTDSAIDKPQQSAELSSAL